MISLILAMDKNQLIGKDNEMPWRLPLDQAYFKKTTYGKTVVMGRKTLESMGGPLEGRKNIVLTKNIDFECEGCILMDSVLEVLKAIEDEEETFIIGGAKIYSLFLPLAHRLYITYIDHEFKGDTYFPKLDLDRWKLKDRTIGIKNEKNPYDYYFEIYDKKEIKNK